MSTLNIYGQRKWHDDVLIVGDREALLDLAKAALIAATGAGRGSSAAFASDGEGYLVRIRCREACCDLRVPYTDPDARSDVGINPERCFE